MFVAAEFAPGCVEFARHSQKIEGEIADIFGGHGEVVVAPSAGWQGLQLHVAEIGKNVVPSARDVAGIVKDRHVRTQGTCGFGGALVVFFESQAGGFEAVFFFLRVESVGKHEVETPATAGLILGNDVQKDAVAIGEEGNCLPDLLAEVIEIGTVKIHHVESRLQDAFGPAGVGAVFVHFAPFGVILRCEIIHSGRQIDRTVDSDFLGGVVLEAEQIEVEAGVNFAHGGGMVAPAVMAL